MFLLLSGCATPPLDTGTVDTAPAVVEEETAVETAVEPPIDADGDGYLEAEDCDDGDETVHPEAVEVCNGKDDDCDQLVDDEDDSVNLATGSVWHPDGDLDGFGTIDVSATACAAPPGWTADSTDCDDTEGTTFPGAPETCDTVDEDCDGLIDETCEPAPTGEHGVHDYSLRITGEGPYFGGVVAGLGDIDADGADDLLVGALVEGGGGEAGAGAAWVVRGPVTTAVDLTGVDPLIRGDTKSERMSNDSVGVGDVDGDGLGDFLVGTYVGQEGRLFLGPATDPSAGPAALLTDALSLGNGDRALTGLGDWNGDGFADIVVGDFGSIRGAETFASGAAYVYQGPFSGTLSADDADATLLGAGDWSCFGFSVAGIGDVDGDGSADMAVTWGYIGYSVGVYYGPFGGTQDGISSADVVIAASESHTDAYRAAAWSPVLSEAEMDADGDGRVDLAVGGELSGSGGTAYLFTSLAGVTGPTDATTTITGDSGRSGAGEPTWAGDLNQDGSADLAMSNSQDGTKVLDGGAVYLFYGPFVPGVSLTGSADAIVYGEEPSGYAGLVVAPGGELTGDGYPDLLFSAPAAMLSGTADGVVWVLPGGP